MKRRPRVSGSRATPALASRPRRRRVRRTGVRNRAEQSSGNERGAKGAADAADRSAECEVVGVVRAPRRLMAIGGAGNRSEELRTA